MTKNRSRRQAVRKGVVLISLLLFPVTINYFSPYVIIDGAAQGIVNGSMIVFGLMFLSSLFVGRLWCSWACPMAGLHEACTPVQPKPARGGRYNWIKWSIWTVWIAGIVAAIVAAGGLRTVNFFHLTENIISTDEPAKYITYYVVLGLFLVTALAAGRRAGCHYFCWMAPFMILGRQLRNTFRWPALRLQADAAKCTDCKTCTRNCPMSLDVNAMVRLGTLNDSECILCGECIDGCARGAIRYTFSSGD